jgi:hypothetical protein
MAGVTGFVRRVGTLPLRARVALGAAAVLAVAGVLLVVLPGGDTGDDPAGGDASDAVGDGGATMPSTTLDTGGIDVAAPDGWQVIPVPDLGFGIAVPPGWEAILLSAEGLATLADASPAVPGFVDNAHAAAASGGLLYAAGEDAAGGVSDVMVQGAPQTGVTDAGGLEAYAGDLAAQAGQTDPQIDVVEAAGLPAVRVRFQVGGAGETAEATRTLVLGTDGIVWSLEVTSDDPAIHDELAGGITDTLTFAAG